MKSWPRYMDTKLPLAGSTILVTRPKQQAKKLSEALAGLGAIVVSMPMIEIVPAAMKIGPKKAIAEQDMLIFVSRNAVACFITGMAEQLSPSTRLVAVGAATARCMAEKGLRVDIQAPAPAGSESLLALTEMQDVAGQKIMIVRGETGRELLADTLRARGANIQYLEVYKRCLPRYTLEEVTRALKVDTIIVTSVAGLENLCQLINDEMMKHKALIVVSERIKQVAMGLGFQRIAVTDDVSDTAIVDHVVKIGQNNGE
jgi:uroporphyrinogen-III synthase